MRFRTMFSLAVLAGAMAVGLVAQVPAAAGGSPDDGEVRYLPVQSISYAFGSKTMSGYFVQKSDTCRVTVMIADKGAAEAPPPPSPARIRLVRAPGQVAGLDSEDGESLNLACGEDAATLLVRTGPRDELIELQQKATRETLAQH